MKLDISAVLNGEVKELPFNFTENVSAEMADIYFKGLDLKASGDIEVSGKVSDLSGYYGLDCKISLPYTTHCSRCGKQIKSCFELDMKRIASAEERDGDEGYIVYSDRKIELDGPVYEELSIGFPSKPLCKTDCRGLCPVCGQDLNEGDCEHSHNNNE